MYKLNFVIAVLSVVILSQCKSLKNTNSIPSFDIITTEVIERETGRGVFKTHKDSIVVVIDILDQKDFIYDSKYLLKILFDNKKALTQYKNDSIYNYDDMDLYITSDNRKYRNLFNKEFKYMSKDIDNLIHFNKSDYTQRWETLMEFDFYINDKNEITYITPGYEKIYHERLKDKLKFSNIFLEKLDNGSD